MQKKLIALAIAGMAAVPAFAQSNVSIYGRIDYGFMSRSGDNGASPNVDRKNEFGSGLQAGSRIGFKGAEDLGNGLKAIFETEFGIGVDAGTGGGAAATWTNRHSYVGLTGGFGTVVGGRLDGVRYGIFNKYDAFGGGGMGNFTQITAQVDRAENAVAYITPNWNGFSGLVAYATHVGATNPLGILNQEGSASPTGVEGNDGDAVLNTVMVNYNNGPIDVTADWERISFKSGGVGTAGAVDDVTVMTLGASYDFGVAKIAAVYDNLEADGRAGAGTIVDVDSWFVSASAPIGKFVVKATYGVTEDDEVNQAKARKIGIGADYLLSKRTNLYASYGRIKNDDGAGIQITPSANCMNNSVAGFGVVANACGTAYGTSGFDIGIAHKF